MKETTKRTPLVYGLLLAVWALVVVWQAVEHRRVQRLARAELIDSARNISTTVGTMIRLSRRWGVFVSKERLESAMRELLQTNKVDGISLLNEAGEVVASVGTPVDPLPKGEVRPAALWEEHAVTLVNPVALGTNVTRDLEGTNPPVIVTFRPPDTNRPPPPPPNFRPPGEPDSSGPSQLSRDRDQFRRREPPVETNGVASFDAGVSSTNAPRGRGPGPGRPRFGGRPPWMSEEEYKSVIQQHGVHSFAIVMSTQKFFATSRGDLWLRSLIGALATLSVVGSGLAWRNLEKTSELQIRLVRASELNTHLKEMNLAAAGLAHETRNPLNIIRGQAQMISKDGTAAEEVRQKSREIVDEVDRVTAQLNEFINYSKPREVRRTSLALGSVIGEVARALSCDVEEKHIHLQVSGDQLTIDADEQLLRQALFNLLLNATQAVDAGGEIEVVAQKRSASEAVLEVRDNGPGVPPDRRSEIFAPYFTTHNKGTGLGLAVVQQIVLAHGWEIECLANEPHGAIFRISHLKLAASHG